MEYCIKDENNSKYYIEKCIKKELMQDLKNSYVIEISNELIKKLNQYDDEEILIVKYSITWSKKIVSITSCNEIIDNF